MAATLLPTPVPTIEQIESSGRRHLSFHSGELGKARTYLASPGSLLLKAYLCTSSRLSVTFEHHQNSKCRILDSTSDEPT
jgi:hypothetical protein